MNELMLKQAEEELVAALHAGGAELSLPLPFERDIFLMGTDVVGTPYIENIDALYEALQEGDRVRLVREPDNPYDEYAIRIDAIPPESGDASRVALAQNCKLGYIPRSSNKVFARLLDAGKDLYGVVRHMEKIKDYCRIVIKVYMRD